MAGKKEFRITTPRGSVFTVTGKNGSTTARLEWAPGFAQKKAEGFSRAQAFVDSECLRYMNPLTPRRTGMLIKSGTLGTWLVPVLLNILPHMPVGSITSIKPRRDGLRR